MNFIKNSKVNNTHRGRNLKSHLELTPEHQNKLKATSSTQITTNWKPTTSRNQNKLINNALRLERPFVKTHQASKSYTLYSSKNFGLCNYFCDKCMNAIHFLRFFQSLVSL